MASAGGVVPSSTPLRPSDPEKQNGSSVATPATPNIADSIRQTLKTIPGTASILKAPTALTDTNSNTSSNEKADIPVEDKGKGKAPYFSLPISRPANLADERPSSRSGTTIRFNDERGLPKSNLHRSLTDGFEDPSPRSRDVQFANTNDYFGGDDSEDGDATPRGGNTAPGTPKRQSGRFKFSRRSQEFHRADTDDDGNTTDDAGTSARPSLFSKIRAFSHTAAHHSRSYSGAIGEGVDDGGNTGSAPMSPIDQVDEEDEFATGEPGSTTSPNTPAMGSMRSPRLRRRATMTDVPDGEGNQGKHRNHPYSRRPSSFRRITELAHSRKSSQDINTAPSPGGGGVSAAKWKALKAGIRMIGQKKKEEAKIDREKSAELVAELTAATPAALILASMFQRDEHGNRRIPIILEQLKIRITDSKLNSKARAHTIFRIELEYGSGLTRMKWVIHREFRDLFNLHTKYRLQDFSYTTLGEGVKHQLPKFPRASIPYLKGLRGLGSLEGQMDDDSSGNETATNTRLNAGSLSTAGPATAGTSSSAAQPRLQEDDDDSEDMALENRKSSIGDSIKRSFSRKTRRPPIRRNSNSTQAMDTIEPGNIGAGIALGIGTLAGAAMGSAPIMRKDGFSIKQRKKLEKYLQELVRIMIFRPDSNRLCKFLELSSLGIRLAAENSYHGKEGFLIIQSSKGSEFRRGWAPGNIAKRHKPKWFLVRHSYIVCVDSPEEMNIYDVILIDSDFQIDAKRSLPKNPKAIASSSKNPTRPQHHKLKIKNSERRIKLLAKNERQLHQFHESIKYMSEHTIWSKKQRFDSFAPVRQYAFAQWLVDGRDYFWNVSRAISMAKDVIYIHDWWLSPEIYLRRPAAVSQKWRLDRLLQRKASEGVKIFVILYRNIGAAVPIDSAYTKYSLLDLHPNIYVQRSPNQLRQNTFFWAHHEKILIVDHTVVFLGGLDLCFGRWDTPQHALVDDKFTGFDETGPKDPDKYQLWPGKDYSNPRVEDFYELNKPYDEMYDRQKIPRMPWHDISMQVVGQPARDLTRHFVQRWNYLLRQRTPSRPTPFLLPPPDFTPQEIESLGIGGSCEVQILRSACAWSMGTPDKNEHSILNAYLKAIETSDHFVYIENQFFITSGELPDGTKMENSIGDALVERIIRAYKNDEDWRAIIVIPLLPGFQSTVDQQEGTSVRLIMQCQFRSICRGEGSIFGKLRANGIEPEDYIQFYALRTWGKIGEQQQLVTEQLYIHAKCMVVDDRIAIIGSANINERSMLGFRDSEIAAVVRDQDTIWSTMAGKPYLVGRFAHTLRLRLMREHLGIDVDELMAEERMEETGGDGAGSEAGWHDGASVTTRATTDLGTPSTNHSVHDGDAGNEIPQYAKTSESNTVRRVEEIASFNHDIDWEQANNPNIDAHKKRTNDQRIKDRKSDVAGLGLDHMKALQDIARENNQKPSAIDRKLGLEGHQYTTSPSQVDGGIIRTGRESMNTLREHRMYGSNGKRSSSVASRKRNASAGGITSPTDITEEDVNPALPPAPMLRYNSAALGLPLTSQLPPLPVTNDYDIGGPAGMPRMSHSSIPGSKSSHPLYNDTHQPFVDIEAFVDPLNDSFYLDVWHQIAMNNTKIFREVFRCQPDNEVKNWAQYKEYQTYQDRFAASQDGEKPSTQERHHKTGGQGAPGVGMPVSLPEKLTEKMGVSGAGSATGDKVGKLAEIIGHLGHHGSDEKNKTDDAEITNEKGTGFTEGGIREADQSKGEGNNPSSPQGKSSINSGVFNEKERPSTDSTATTDKDGQLRDPRASDVSIKRESTRSSNQHSNIASGSTAMNTSTSLPVNGGATGSSTTNTASLHPAMSTRRRKRAGTRNSRREFHASDEVIDKDVAQELLSLIQGHLVVWPYEWLITEAEGGNWLYSIDQLAPIEIYD